MTNQSEYWLKQEIRIENNILQIDWMMVKIFFCQSVVLVPYLIIKIYWQIIEIKLDSNIDLLDESDSGLKNPNYHTCRLIE